MTLLLIDMDGTLIDSEPSHVAAYNNVLPREKLSLDIFKKGVDTFLKKYYTSEEIKIIRKNKLNELKNFEINFMNGAEEFIDYIHINNVNHVVVTNARQQAVDIFKEKLPHLKKLKNWITREDVLHTKPDPECFRLAVEKYKKNESRVIGVENSYNGYMAVKEVTPFVYIMGDKDISMDQGIFINNLMDIITLEDHQEYQIQTEFGINII